MVEKKNRFMERFGLNPRNRSQIIFFFDQFPHLPSKFRRQIRILVANFNFFRCSDRRRDRTRIITATPHNHRQSHLNSSIPQDLVAAGAGLRSCPDRRARRILAEVRWNSERIWEQMDHCWKGARASSSLKPPSIAADFGSFYFNFYLFILLFLNLFIYLFWGDALGKWR